MANDGYLLVLYDKWKKKPFKKANHAYKECFPTSYAMLLKDLVKPNPFVALDREFPSR